MGARGYGQFCPVAKACELVAERWTPLVIRELMCGTQRFSALHRGLRSMSRTLLAKRWRELEDAGVVRSEERPNGHGREYRLTEAGEELRPIIEMLGAWGARWTERELDPADLDAELLMVDIQRRIHTSALPAKSTVARFEFSGMPRKLARPNTWWLVLDRREVDLCHRNPGYQVDLVVAADLRTFAEVWVGRTPLADARRRGAVTIEGPRDLVRAFPTWLQLSVFAKAGAAVAAG